MEESAWTRTRTARFARASAAFKTAGLSFAQLSMADRVRFERVVRRSRPEKGNTKLRHATRCVLPCRSISLVRSIFASMRRSERVLWSRKQNSTTAPTGDGSRLILVFSCQRSRGQREVPHLEPRVRILGRSTGLEPVCTCVTSKPRTLMRPNARKRRGGRAFLRGPLGDFSLQRCLYHVKKLDASSPKLRTTM